jgi:phosphoribosylamine-glycine ligase
LGTAVDYVLVVTGPGAKLSEAARNAYTTLKKLDVPAGPLLRDDIGRKLKKQLPKLHALGYMLGHEY